MHTEIDRMLAVRGFVTRPQMLDCGYNDDAIRALRHLGLLITIGPGLYAGAGYASLSEDERHLLRIRAVNTRFEPGTVVFSHQSAALVHGAFVWGVGLGEVQLTRSDIGRSRHQAAVFHHVGEMPAGEMTEVGGLLVTTGARTAWDLAVSEEREAALVTAGSLLHLGLADADDYARIASRNHSWRGAGVATITLEWADAGAHSPGESRTRYTCRTFDLPEPVLQMKIFDDEGALMGIVDLAWPEYRHIAEFDGKVKYGTGRDLAREKWREDRIRALAWGITRIVWSQLDPARRHLLAKELFEAMKRSRRIYRTAAA